MQRWSDVYKWSQQRDNENVSSDTLPLLNREFKCGESDHGNTLRLKLSHFLSYARNNKDDSPLYVFDGTFDDDKASKTLLDDYSPPSFFQEDLFHLVGERRRPPYRWWLLGPERSGTTVHIDPLGTSAWNTLIVGKKRWVLFPPDTPKDVVKSKKLFLKSEDDEAVNYFCDLLPRLKEKHRDLQVSERKSGNEMATTTPPTSSAKLTPLNAPSRRRFTNSPKTPATPSMFPRDGGMLSSTSPTRLQ